MSAETESPRSVLIVRPSALGDVARTVPALVSIKRRWPEARVDWLVRDSFAEVIAQHPDLHAVIPFPRSRFDRFWRSPRVMGEVMRYCDALWRRDYDLTIDLQGLGRSGMFTWFTRAPHRVGLADAREGAWLGYTRWVRIDTGVVHTVDRMLGVVEAAGAAIVRDMRLYCADSDRVWADTVLSRHGVAAERVAVIAPTAKWLSKCWPIDRYEAVARALGDRGFDAVAVIGAQSDLGMTRPLVESGAGPKRIDLVGQTTVGQMMAAIERSGLVVANDSAALHIAVGLNRRCVGVFGPTDPDAVGPYRYDLGVVRPPDDTAVSYRALRDDQSVIARVSVTNVLETIDRVLAAAAPLSAWGHPSEEAATLGAG